MASQNLNVGTAANANDGDTLRAAFIKVRKMFHEIYGITTTYADDLDLSTGGETFAESVQDIIGGMVSGNTEDNIQVTYDDANNKLNFSVAADITDVNAGYGLSGVNESGGAATLSLDLNELTSATVDVAADSIPIIDSSDSNATRKESIADIVSGIAGSGLTATNGVITVDAIGTSGISDDAVTAAKIEKFDDALAATDGHILVADGTDFSNVEVGGDATIDNTGSLTIGSDKITYAKLGSEFTTKATIPSDYDVDFSTAAVFEDTMDADIDYDIENPKVGDVKTLVLTGDGTDRTISFLMSGSTGETFNKMKGSDAFSFTSGDKNLVQIICVDDTANSEVFWYSNSVVAS